MQRYESVDAYIDGHPEWHDELVKLRDILNSTELVETVKWGAPCYTINGKHVVGLGAFKNFVSLWFFQGVFLKDQKQVLINAQEGRTKGLRQWRFEAIKDIKPRNIMTYVNEAIELQKQGKEIKPDRSKPVEVPLELQQALDKNKQLRLKFDKFTKGRQREFAEHIASAKRAETKQARLDKITPMILDGVGLNDKYRNC